MIDAFHAREAVTCIRSIAQKLVTPLVALFSF